jgi:DHA1 family bicyclomycin/chloramphenicol resistance-like MFS transporter
LKSSGSGANRRTFIAVVAMLASFGPMSIDMYLPSLPAIAAEFDTPARDVQWTLSAFFAGFALGQLINGPLSDRFGRLPVLRCGIALFIVTSALCALGSNVWQLAGLRILQALGASAASVLSRAIIRDTLSGDRAAQAMSLVAMVMAAAPLAAPFIGGYVQVFLDWRWIFWVLMGFGLIALTVVSLYLAESHPPERRLKSGVSGIMIGYWRILRHRRALGYLLAAATAYAGMFAYFAGSPFVFIEVYGVRAQDYGFLFAINIIGLMLVSYLNSRIVTRIGAHTLCGVGTLTGAAAALVLLLNAATGMGGLVGLVVPILFIIASLSLIGANAISCALDYFPQISGTLSALFGGMQFAFGALAAGAVGAFSGHGALAMAGVIACTSFVSLLARFTLAAGPVERRGDVNSS